MRTPTNIDGSIKTIYVIPDGEALHHIVADEEAGRMAITRVVVTAWYDGEADVTLHARPLTRNGTVHRGRTERALYGSDRSEVLAVCKALDIDATATTAVRAITSNYQYGEE